MRSEPTTAAGRALPLTVRIHADIAAIVQDSEIVQDFKRVARQHWGSGVAIEAEARQQDSEALRLLYVPLRVSNAIIEHIEREAERTGTYHGDPAGTPGGTGYCIPAAVATQIVDKYLLEYLAALPATPSGEPALDVERLAAALDELSDDGLEYALMAPEDRESRYEAAERLAAAYQQAVGSEREARNERAGG